MAVCGEDVGDGEDVGRGEGAVCADAVCQPPATVQMKASKITRPVTRFGQTNVRCLYLNIGVFGAVSKKG